MKIGVIGAGSLFFGREVIWAVNHLDGLREANLALVDIDEDRLDKMVRLAHLARESSGAGYRVDGFTDYREALPNADFVVLSFSSDNVHYRRIDCAVSAQYGIRMCSGDTIGPGGVFRALRDLPKVLEIARSVEETCPEAWIINYINPSTVNGIALMRHSRTRSFALCDSLQPRSLKKKYFDVLGIDPGKTGRLQLKIAGVNHFTWLWEATCEGRDMLPDLRRAIEKKAVNETDEGYSKRRFSNGMTLQLWDIFGACPACMGHTKEYLPF